MEAFEEDMEMFDFLPDFNNDALISTFENTSMANEDHDKEIARKEQIRKAVKKYRNRKKEELEYLRKRVVQLQTKLKSLREKPTSTLSTCKKSLEENASLKSQLQHQMQFARKLLELVDTKTSNFPRYTSSNTIVSANPETRQHQLETIAQYELDHVDESMKTLLQIPPSQYPYTETNIRNRNGERQLQVTKAVFFAGFTPENVGVAVEKLFSAHIQLPRIPSGGPVCFENLQTLSPYCTYSRLVCQMGTSQDQLPKMEKLVLRIRNSARQSTKFAWRTICRDNLHPNTLPRIDENGSICIVPQTQHQQRGAALLLSVYIRPPLHTIALPPGAIIESYMTGFLEYMDEVHQLLGYMLLTNTN